MSEETTEQFPPKPGGAVDSARKAASAVNAVEEPAEVSGRYSAVRVLPEASLVAQANTVVVQTGGPLIDVQRVLGFDVNRKRAVIVTLDEPVVVAVSQSQANDSRNAGNVAGLSAGGFVLPAGVQFTVESASEVWVAATSVTPTRVSTWNETYSGQGQ